MHVVDASDADTIHRMDDVALLEARTSCRTVSLDRRDAYGTGNRELVRTGKRTRNVDVLSRDADIGATRRTARC
jgi:hypothetical protein